MALIVKTIGTSARDYSTITAWEAGLPANLVTDGNSYEGDCYNDSEFSEALTPAAHVTDATHTIKLTTGASQSFQDNVNVRTNALRYNQANGVAWKNTTNYAITLNVANNLDYFTISKLQIKNLAAAADPVIIDNWGMLHALYKDLVLEMTGASNVLSASAGTAVNVLAINLSTAGNGIQCTGTATLIGCTVVRPANISAAGTGFDRTAGTPILQSCATFGFSTSASTGWDGTNSKNNGTEQSSGLPGSSNQHSIAYSQTSPFTNSNTTSGDYRTVTGTNLSANGFRDSTNAPNDISATARTGTPTIGHWELTLATITPPSLLPLIGVG